MDNLEQQVVDRLKQANNILVTVRNDPTVDLLSACIGLTLVLDKLNKHAAAVFSGEVPSTIEFLKPEDTLEQTPDSLRDFIIALDRSKADKLRYKLEDKVVRIFITPYRTSLSQSDLQFSQGDFNIDAIVALGAHEQQELDQAITTHGRILHDAIIMSVNNTPNGNLGSINWQNTRSSSLCEMVAQLVKDLDKGVLDEQIATALLTGIVAETDRFSNEKTTPRTMSLAGELMAAGANQQLVASQLHGDKETSGSAPEPPKRPSGKHQSASKEDDNDDNEGSLQIEHPEEEALPETTADARPSTPPPPGHELLPTPQPSQANDAYQTPGFSDQDLPPASPSYLADSPTGLPDIADREQPVDDKGDTPSFPTPAPIPPAAASASPAVHPPVTDDETLTEIEETVDSPHIDQATSAHDQTLDAARTEVLNALQAGPQPLEPLTALNAQHLSEELHPPQVESQPAGFRNDVDVDAEGNLTSLTPPPLPTLEPEAAPNPESPANQPLDMPLPPVSSIPSPQLAPVDPEPPMHLPPPPVPPPITPNFINPGS